MKFYYYPDTDSLYIDLINKKGTESREIAPGIALDFDAEGSLVGIDIDHASKNVDLAKLEMQALPLKDILLHNDITTK